MADYREIDGSLAVRVDRGYLKSIRALMRSSVVLVQVPTRAEDPVVRRPSGHRGTQHGAKGRPACRPHPAVRSPYRYRTVCAIPR